MKKLTLVFSGSGHTRDSAIEDDVLPKTSPSPARGSVPSSHDAAVPAMECRCRDNGRSTHRQSDTLTPRWASIDNRTTRPLRGDDRLGDESVPERTAHSVRQAKLPTARW